MSFGPKPTAGATGAMWDVSQIPSLAGKVAIVTGANSGIGYVTALELAKKQAHVVLACRNAERGQCAERDIKAAVGRDAAVEFMMMDLSDVDSVRAFVTAFRVKFDRLDLLVNNGGLMLPAQTHTADGLETQFAVNHLGHFLLTSLLFDKPDLLKNCSEPSRIVNVSSVAHSWATIDFNTLARSKPGKTAYVDEYATSKLANLLFTYELDRRITAAGLSGQILSVAAHPGITVSELPSKMLAAYLPTWMMDFMDKLLAIAPVFQATERGALPSLFAATDSSVESGSFFGPNGFLGIWGRAPAKMQSSDASYSEEDATALWILSEDTAHCKFELSK